MGFLKTNHKEAQGGGLAEPGTYECFIKKMDTEHASAQKGTPGTEVLFVIRDDVEQDHGGSKIYDRLYDVEAAMWRYQQLSKGAGVPDGTDFDTKEDMKKEILGNSIKVTIKHEGYTNASGEEKTSIRVEKYEESDEGGQMKPEDMNDNNESNGKPIEIKDDDLPF